MMWIFAGRVRCGFAWVYTIILIYITSSQAIFLLDNHASRNTTSDPFVALILTSTFLAITVIQLLLFHLLNYFSPGVRQFIQVNPKPSAEHGIGIIANTSSAFLKELLPIGTAIVTCGHLIMQVVIVGACPGASGSDPLGVSLFNYCNPQSSTGGLPADTLLLASVLPVLHIMIQSASQQESTAEISQNRYAVLIQAATVSISATSIALCSLSLSFFGVAVSLVLMLLLDWQLIDSNTRMKHLVQQSNLMVEQTVAEQKKEGAEHNNEMRHMVRTLPIAIDRYSLTHSLTAVRSFCTCSLALVHSNHRLAFGVVGVFGLRADCECRPRS